MTQDLYCTVDDDDDDDDAEESIESWYDDVWGKRQSPPAFLFLRR